MAEIKPFTYAERLASEPAIFIWLKKVYIQIVLLAADYGALSAATVTAYYLRQHFFSAWFSLPYFTLHDMYLYLLIPVPFIVLLHFDGHYSRHLPFGQEAGRLLKISVYSMAMVVCMLYISHAAHDVSRLFVALTAFLTYFYLLAERLLIKKLLIARDMWKTPIVIVGAGKTAALLVKQFQDDPSLGYKVVGFIEDHEKTEADALTPYPILGNFSQAAECIQKSGIRNIVIAAPGLDREALHNLIYRLQPYVDDITFVPDLFGIPACSMELDTLLQEKTALLRVRNNLARWTNRLIKYFFDFFVSLLLLPFVVLFLVVIALFTYLNSPGPVFFVQQRVGKGGQFFPCYKIRTMVTNAEEKLAQYLQENPTACQEWQTDFKLKEDPRVTPIGKFLRKTSLDELPQLFNVLRGEMSLVGPRPIIAEEVVRYGEYIQDYHMVRPGITGMWQVSGRSDVSYEERVQLDSWYVRNWSLWLDIVTLFKTVGVVLKRKGAY
ncbi:MAG: undecaprenyl-phosphate galactose phosphotransferase WbaP [Sporomusaceae bacterium]|nr:undecaprenyl-phosphate galactose phosphotransferase WbaP [Sporomusaceae bacterium]